MSAMGCEAAPKQAASAGSDTPMRLVLLLVPGRSRTSPLLRPSGRSLCFRTHRNIAISTETEVL
ncbi:hypothetical protein F4W67_12505 [Pseudomonas caricapapayae]|nr:hypothetical protein F4W67_12505 [Pseudomonas caricapapayae]